MSMFNGANTLDPNTINPSPIMPGSQVVIPQITIPQTQNLNRVITQRPINQIVIKGGDEVAKKFKIPPNSRVAIFDEDEMIFWVKETDEYGNEVTFKKCTYTEIEDPPEPQYVTIEDLKSILGDFGKDLKEELLNGQFVRTQKQSYGNGKSYSSESDANPDSANSK